MRRLALFLVPLLFLACERQPAAPDAANAPSFGISNAPPMSGIVVRNGFPEVPVFGDPSAGLTVVQGVDARVVCTRFDPADWHIDTYADKQLRDRIVTIGQDKDIPTQVWSYGGPTHETICAMVLGGAEPLATGVARFVYVSNDLFGTGRGNDVTNADSHGLLTRPDGSQAVFHLKVRFTQGAPTNVTISLR